MAVDTKEDLMKSPGIQGRILALASVFLFLFSGVLVSCKAASLEASPEPTSTSGVPASIIISPEESYNPVMTQHTVVASVLTEGGEPAVGTTVEWILNRFPGAVGDIVSAYNTQGGLKSDNYYATTKTDDKGEAKIIITATRPGDTDITAYVPAIQDPAKHKVFATKHWVNIQVRWPEDATNVTLTSHVFTVRLMTVVTEVQLPGYPEGWTTIRMGVGEGLEGYELHWTIVDDDPAIYFAEGDQRTKVWTSTSDGRGEALVTIEQVRAGRGENTIQIEVLSHDGITMFQHRVKKTWIAPMLELTKGGPETAVLGERVTYHILVKNTGDGDATGVVVRDTIPEGMMFLSSQPGAKVSGDTVSWNLGTLHAGDSVSITLVLKASRAGCWTDMARATSVEELVDEASATTCVIAPSIEIEKTGPAELTQGTNGTYTITVRNTGESTLTDVRVTDQIPQGMGYVSSSLVGTQADNQVSWGLGSLSSGQQRTISLTLKGETAGTWTNSASVTCDEGVTDTDSATTRVIAPSVEIEKTGPAELTQGTNATYTITVRNTGESTLTDVRVTDQIPQGMSYVGSSLVGTQADNQVSWGLGSLSSGQQRTISLTLRGETVGTWTNSASVTCDEGVTDTDSATTRVIAPSVEIEKTGPTARYLLQTADYVIRVRNTGDVVLNDVTVTDEIPTGMSFVSSTGGGTVFGRSITWDLGSMNPGETKQFGLTLRCDQRDTWTNVATVTTKEGATDTSEQETLVIAEAGLTISSTDRVDPIAVGERTTYVITIRNQGEIDVHNVVIVDALPVQTKFISATGPATYSVSAGRVTFLPVAVLAVGESLIYEITVEAVYGGSALNRVTLTYDEFRLQVIVEEGTTIF